MLVNMYKLCLDKFKLILRFNNSFSISANVLFNLYFDVYHIIWNHNFVRTSAQTWPFVQYSFCWKRELVQNDPKILLTWMWEWLIVKTKQDIYNLFLFIPLPQIETFWISSLLNQVSTYVFLEIESRNDPYNCNFKSSAGFSSAKRASLTIFTEFVFPENSKRSIFCFLFNIGHFRF